MKNSTASLGLVTSSSSTKKFDIASFASSIVQHKIVNSSDSKDDHLPPPPESDTYDHLFSVDDPTIYDESMRQADELLRDKLSMLTTASPLIVQELDRRLSMGRGEFLLELGRVEQSMDVDDLLSMPPLTPQVFDGVVAGLKSAANSVGAAATVISDRRSAGGLVSAHLLLRRSFVGKTEDVIEVRIACAGNVDAGKSTLLGVLCTQDLDDGRGGARASMFRHKHELDTGRTSSVGMELMGFDAVGNQIAKTNTGRRLAWEDVAAESSKVISFLDLAGHERYLKTTVFGMTGCAPDYVMLIVGSNAGIIGMTKEHLGLALALNVPVLIVITKIDMAPKSILENSLQQVFKILKSPGCRKVPMLVKDVDDVVKTAQTFISERTCPIFQISSVKGTGLDLLRQFLNLLPVHHNYVKTEPVHYQITDTFSVPGVGTVVSGTTISGSIHTGMSLLIGPDSTGQFVSCIVKSIQRKRLGVPVTYAGQSSSIALKKFKRSAIRKGMVLLGKEIQPVSCWEFEAEIIVLYHSSTIATKYQAMVHSGNVRQTAKIMGIRQDGIGANCSDTTLNELTKKHNENSTSMEDESLVIRTGDRAIVRFRFLQYPEYLTVGARVLFREGRTKGVGKITSVA